MADDHYDGMTRIIGELMDELDVFVFLQIIACPVQIYGSVDGAHLDFRARGTWWRLTIGADYEVAERYSDEAHAASWIAPADVKRILTDQITAYREAHPTPTESKEWIR